MIYLGYSNKDLWCVTFKRWHPPGHLLALYDDVSKSCVIVADDGKVTTHSEVNDENIQQAYNLKEIKNTPPLFKLLIQKNDVV